MPERPHAYYNFTLSLCPHFLRRMEAKILFADEAAYMLKRCASALMLSGRGSMR